MRIPILSATKLRFHTSLAPADVEAELRRHTTVGYTWSLWRDPAIWFRGTVGTGQFRLTALPNGRNSWAAECRGVIAGEGTGSVVELELGVSPLVWAFSAMWLLPVLSAGVVVPFAGDLRVGLIPVGMVAFFVLLTWVGTTFGRRLARRRFTDALGAEAEDVPAGAS